MRATEGGAGRSEVVGALMGLDGDVTEGLIDLLSDLVGRSEAGPRGRTDNRNATHPNPKGHMFSEQIEEHPEWNKKKYRRTRDELFDKKPKKKKTRGGSSPTTTMADTQIIPPQHDLDAKWDACLDLTVRRFVYSSSAGSPVTRWASIAFGAGVGIGSAYAECSRLFDGPPTKLPLPKVSETVAQFDYTAYFSVLTGHQCDNIAHGGKAPTRCHNAKKSEFSCDR
ncbi:hypothetical protein V8G54_027379 [Vigna mungo]|uniref:MICOS complex subunit MIC10 n=1 Tax=Vigna mungo TaxID=3915 RepID=A0AAQ3N2L0_VIGMU